MTIHVACAATGGYVPHAATMLKSLLLNTPDSAFCIHFLHDHDFGSRQSRQLEQMLSAHGASLHCINASIDLPDGLPIVAEYSAAAWFRVLLPDLLPELDRVLYLDCDLIVVDSLLPLWRSPLNDHLLAAVTNSYAHDPEMMSVLGLPGPSSYFNTGVMLLNLDLMRREEVTTQVFAYAKAYPQRVRYAEQDPMNAVLHARRLCLPLRYNVQMDCYSAGYAQLVLPEKEVRDAVAHPAVVHYSSQEWKPWHYCCEHPLRALYVEYRRQTPWPRFKPEGATYERRIHRLKQRISNWRRGRLSRD